MEKISRLRVTFTNLSLTGASTGYATVKASGIYMSKGTFMHHVITAKNGEQGPVTIHARGRQVRNFIDYGYFVQLYF